MLSSWNKLIWLTIFTCNALTSSPAVSKVLETTKPEDVPALIKLLKNRKADIRENAADKLGMLWPKQDVNGAVTALIKAMKDPSNKVRLRVASALGELKASQAVDVLISALHDRDSEVVLFSAQALGDIGPEASSAAPELINLLRNEDNKIRSTAAIALSKTGNVIERAVNVMTEDLKLCDPWSRQEALFALGYLGLAAQSAIPELRNLLKDQSKYVQQEACRTLRYIGTSEAKVALSDYPQSCDSQANITIGVEQTVSMLIEDLNLPSEMSRLSAISNLGLKGQSAKSAVPALKNLLNDPSLHIQHEACHSLHLIGTPEAKEAITEYAGICTSDFRN